MDSLMNIEVLKIDKYDIQYFNYAAFIISFQLIKPKPINVKGYCDVQVILKTK